MTLRNDNTKVNIGRFSGAVGLKGEVRVTLYAKDSENLHEGSKLFVEGPGGDISEFEVLGLRYQKEKPVVTLRGVTDRSFAETLNGTEIYIDESALAALPEGEYYFREIEGLEVYDMVSGETVGTVAHVLEYPAHNIYLVKGIDGNEVMIPAVEAFIKDIDIERGVMEVELIEGMI